jgi:hypothetical protein
MMHQGIPMRSVTWNQATFPDVKGDSKNYAA